MVALLWVQSPLHGQWTLLYAIASADQSPLPRLYSTTGMALRRR